MGKFISLDKHYSEELILKNKSLIKTDGIDFRNKTEDCNIEDIINFFYKKELLNTLLNNNVNYQYKLNFIERNNVLSDFYSSYNITKGGFWKDWD